MNREHKAELGVAGAQGPQRAADVLQALAEVLAPVRRDQHKIAVGKQVRHLALVGPCAPLRLNQADGIDHGVAAGHDVAGRDALGQQVGAGLGRGREMPLGQARDHGPVGLFRKRAVAVAGAQARLDVGDRDALVKRGQGGGKRGGGVALHDHDLRPLLGQGLAHAFDERGGQCGQGLVRAHQRKLDVGAHAKTVQCLVQHLAVLAGGADQQLDTGARTRFYDHRGQLDDFGSGAKHHHELLHDNRPPVGTGSDWPR
ncbi:hypothetical protein D9M68_748370 [compost metagenome]